MIVEVRDHGAVTGDLVLLLRALEVLSSLLWREAEEVKATDRERCGLVVRNMVLLSSLKGGLVGGEERLGSGEFMCEDFGVGGDSFDDCAMTWEEGTELLSRADLVLDVFPKCDSSPVSMLYNLRGMAVAYSSCSSSCWTLSWQSPNRVVGVSLVISTVAAGTVFCCCCCPCCCPCCCCGTVVAPPNKFGFGAVLDPSPKPPPVLRVFPPVAGAGELHQAPPSQLKLSQQLHPIRAARKYPQKRPSRLLRRRPK
jgi:hypothetical protein